jgi:hypothetical protein
MNKDQQDPQKPKRIKSQKTKSNQSGQENPKPATKTAPKPKTEPVHVAEPIVEPNIEQSEKIADPIEPVNLVEKPVFPSPGFESIYDDPSIQKMPNLMIPFLPKPKIDIKTLLILGLSVALILMSLLNGCHDKKETGKIIKVCGKSYEVIKHDIDTIITEHETTVTKPGKDIYHDTTIYVPVPQFVDTSAILRDYYSKKVKKDSLTLPDSLGYVKVTDTLFQNDILARKWEAMVRKTTISEKLIVKDLPKNQVYVGLTTGFNKVNLVNYAGPTFLLKTKKDKLYSLGFGYSTAGSVSLQGGVYWKIKLKK